MWNGKRSLGSDSGEVCKSSPGLWMIGKVECMLWSWRKTAMV